MHQVARSGVADGGHALPFADRIQFSFGRHDVGGIRAHSGSAASRASAALGAQAYATGRDVAFRGAPDLFTAAHEAAHVVQQRAGVQLRGGVGAAGDRYEQHADAVAREVVAGRSAEALLSSYAPSGAAGAAIQRKEAAAAKDAGAAGGAKAIDEATADRDFNAWLAEHDRLVAAGKRPPAPSEEAKWTWALDKVKAQIQPRVLPEGYRPPPQRESKSAPAPAAPAAKTDAGGAATTYGPPAPEAAPEAKKPAGPAPEPGAPTQADYERYRQNSARGVQVLRETIEGLKLFPSLPPRFAREAYLKAVKRGWQCQKDPAANDKILADVRHEYGLDQPAPPTVEQGQPGDIERAKAREGAGRRFLDDLDWACKNPIGAGAYGVYNASGQDHDTAMAGAKRVQGVFDIATAGADAERESMERQRTVDTAQTGTTPDPAAERPR
ncbi:MAG: DUF4157 domain-containing protein [Myxococcota bacterium]